MAATAPQRSAQAAVRWSKVFLSRLPVHHRQALPKLPVHYQVALFEKQTREPIPVHWVPEPGKYKTCLHTGERIRVQNVPIWVNQPKAADEGLWGGEGVVTGYKLTGKKKYNIRRNPSMQRPMLLQRIFYSDILDLHLTTTCTLRTLKLIDEAHGFDNYILETHEVDLKSKLGMKLKREMLLRLARGELPGNEQEKQKLREKYDRFFIPESEAEWVGLDLSEAVQKLLAAEKERDAPVAHKLHLAQGLIRQLRGDTQDGEEQPPEDSPKSSDGGFLSGLNPFSSKKSADS